jgi:hypothetical protein
VIKDRNKFGAMLEDLIKQIAAFRPRDMRQLDAFVVEVRLQGYLTNKKHPPPRTLQ